MPRLIPCPLCGGDKFTLFQVDHGAQVVRCAGCRFMYVNPQPTGEELHSLYAKYYPADNDGLARSLEVRLPVFKRGVQILQRLGVKGRVIDIGCGTGDFVRAARDAGWEAVGVEFSEHAATYATRQGLQVRTGSLMDQHFPEGYFDAATLWDVLEHLPDPRREVSEVWRVLKPRGVLVVRVPNTPFQIVKMRVWAAVFGSGPFGLQADLHLNHFTSQTLKLLLRSCGLEVFREEAGVSEDFVHGGGVPVGVKRFYCHVAQAISNLAGIQVGPTLVQCARKVRRSG